MNRPTPPWIATRPWMALSLVAGIAIAVAPLTAVAQSQATGSFNVTLTVPGACTVSATAAAFPDSSGAAQQTAEATVTVNCTNGTNYTVGLDKGTHGTATQRRMSNGTDTIDYGLYADPSHLSGWGDSDLSSPTFTAAPTRVSGAGIGSDQADIVYALLPAFSGKSAGDYSDIVNVIVEF